MPPELTLEERIAQRRAAKTTAPTASLDERIAARRAARPRGRTPEQLAANPPIEPTKDAKLGLGPLGPIVANPLVTGAMALADDDEAFDSPARRIKRADKEGVSPATLRMMEKRKKEREAEAAKGRAVGAQRQYEARLREGTVNERQVETNRRASEIMAHADEVARRRAAEKQQKMGLLGAATDFGTEPKSVDLTASPYLGTAVDIGESVFGDLPSIETPQDRYTPTLNMAGNVASQLGQAVLTGGASGAGRIAQGIRGLQATRGGRAALSGGIGASQVLRSTGLEDPGSIGTGALMGVLGGTIGAEKARDVLGVLGADAAATLADMVRADPELAMRIAEGRMLPGDEEMLVQAGLSSALPPLAGSALELGQRSIGRRYQEGVSRAQEEARQQRVGLSEKARLESDARLRGYEEQGDLDAAVLEEQRLRADQAERAALEGRELRRGVFDEELALMDEAARNESLRRRIEDDLARVEGEDLAREMGERRVLPEQMGITREILGEQRPRRPAVLEPLTPEEAARGDWYVPERGGEVSPELAARLRARIEESAPEATLDDLLRNVRTRDYPYGEQAPSLLERARELDQPRIEERDRRIEEMRQQLRRGERPKTRLSGRQRRGDRGFIGFPTFRSRRPHAPMPATDASRSSFDADAPQAPRTAWAKRTWDSINRNFLDQYAALKKTQERYGGTFYDQARRAGYADGIATAYIEDGIIDPVTGARLSEGAKKIIARPLSSTDPKATLADETLAKRFSTYTNALRVLDVASRPQQMPADEPAANVASAAQAIGLKSPEAKRVIAGKLSAADLSAVIEQINKFTGADGMAERAIFGKLLPMDINEAQQIVGEMEGAYDNARTIAREISDYFNALLRNQVAMGDLSEQDYRRIVARNKWYFPLYRVTDGSELDDLGLTSPSYTGGKSFAQVPKSPKKLKGSDLQVMPVLDSLVRKTFDSVNYANRSAVFNSIADTIDRVTAETDDPDLLPFRRYDGEVKEDQSHPGKLRGKNGEFVIRGRRNGEEQMYAVEPEVYAAMHAMGARSGSGFWETVIRGLGGVRGLQAAGITAALPFTIANAVIDAPTAFLQSEIKDWRGKTPFYHVFRGMMLQAFPSLRKSAAMQAFGQSGIRGTNELRNVDTRRDPGEVTRQITGRVGTGRKVAAAVTLGASEVGRGLYTVLRGISDRIEAAPRMAEFEGVFEQELAAGKSYKDATLAATRAAQDVTVDFRRGGTAAKEINRVSLFFNPAIQGTLREVENFKKRPAKTLAKMGIVFGLPALASMLTVAGDEEYWQIPESDRARYFYFPNPRYDEADPDSTPYLRIPKPRGPLAQAMIQGMEATFGTLVRMRAQGIPFDAEMMAKASPNMKRLLEAIENPQQADETAKRMLGAFLTSFVSAAEPALEVMQDYDYFRERPIVGRREKDLAPELQYNRDYTNPAYVFAAKRLAESGINLSPAIVQHLVDGYGGTLARDAADLLGTAAVKLGGQEKTLPLVVGKKPPIIGRFLGSKAERGSQQVQDFWDEYGRFTRTQRSYKALKNEGRFTDAREFKERNAALLDRNAEIEKAYKRMEIQFGIIERAMATARKDPSKEEASKAKIDAASKRIGDIGLEYWKKFGERKAFER